MRPRLQKEGGVQGPARPVEGKIRSGRLHRGAVGGGEIEPGIHPISEILPVKGVKLVGELPR